MTFDEWWHSKGWNFGSEKAKAAWEAATLAERERCAKVSENGHFLHDDAPDARFGAACAAAIRSKS